MMVIAEKMKGFRKDTDEKDRRYNEKFDNHFNDIQINTRDLKFLGGGIDELKIELNGLLQRMEQMSQES